MKCEKSKGVSGKAKGKKSDTVASLKGKALCLEELVDYSDDSIVSKTLVDSKAGTMTLFAFDAGQKLSEHSAPYDAAVQVLDGAVALTIAGKTVKASKGQLVIMPATIPHAVTAKERFKMLLTMIRG